MEHLMQALTHRRSHFSAQDRERTWPLDARMAMFVLEAAGHDPETIRERAQERHACRIIATVCGPDRRSLSHSILYVRDITPGHMGFICQSDLPVGATVSLNCTTEEGQNIRGECRIGRSRQFMQGWNEGVLHIRD
jgi:hypothetical protein